MRLVVLLALGAVACGGDDDADATAADATKPTLSGALEATSADFRWTWTEDADTFNLVVTRNGVADAQREIDPTLRSWLVPVDGANEVDLANQACRRHTLGKSTCSAWSSASVHR